MTERDWPDCIIVWGTFPSMLTGQWARRGVRHYTDETMRYVPEAALSEALERADKAAAERDALKARVRELEEELERAHRCSVGDEDRDDVLAWMCSNDTGSSSKVMAAVLSGADLGRLHAPLDHPHDAGDFGRCLRLLDRVPNLRSRLHRMRSVSVIWDRLVTCWDELEALMREEVGEDVPWGRSAPRTTRMIYRIVQNDLGDCAALAGPGEG